MADLTISIPDDLDARLRRAAQQRGGSLSDYVSQAIQKQLFWETVRDVQDRNADLAPDAAQRLADEAVGRTRAAGS